MIKSLTIKNKDYDKKRNRNKKYVSSEFKNRLEMIWEDMIDDQEFGRCFTLSSDSTMMIVFKMD